MKSRECKFRGKLEITIQCECGKELVFGLWDDFYNFVECLDCRRIYKADCKISKEEK